MTLVEFLAPLNKSKNQDRILAILYFKEEHEQVPALTVQEIRSALKSARIKNWAKMNIADVLNKCAHLVDSNEMQGKRRLWGLTESGKSQVRSLLGISKVDIELEHDVDTLQILVDKISDNDVKDYFHEALKCLRVGALRACIVFVWSGAIRTIQSGLLIKGASAVTTSIQKHDPKSRAIGRLDDFSYIKDSIVLLAAQDLGLIDKNQKDTLKENLDLRNRCGHPGKYKPGEKKVSSFIEDIVSILFP